MPVVLLLVILGLVSGVSVALRSLEKLAQLREYHQHRRGGYALFFSVLGVVVILEALLQGKLVVFRVPRTLYGIHVATAVCSTPLFSPKR